MAIVNDVVRNELQDHLFEEAIGSMPLQPLHLQSRWWRVRLCVEVQVVNASNPAESAYKADRKPSCHAWKGQTLIW